MKLHVFFSVALILLAYSSQGALAQEGRGRECPIVSVSLVETAGPTKIYKANIEGGDSSVIPKFNWTVLSGMITRGQGTSEVSVEANGNDSLSVTVEAIGYASNCQTKASYTSIVHRVMSRKFDEYRDLKFNEERLRLDQFAIALHNEPKSKGYIIVYDVTDTRKPRVTERGERAKKYLVKERGLPEAHIVVVNGGRRDTRSVELFITPAGALPPTATPK
jgi:hypothetical protein